MYAFEYEKLNEELTKMMYGGWDYLSSEEEKKKYYEKIVWINDIKSLTLENKKLVSKEEILIDQLNKAGRYTYNGKEVIFSQYIKLNNSGNLLEETGFKVEENEYLTILNDEVRLVCTKKYNLETQKYHAEEYAMSLKDAISVTDDVKIFVFDRNVFIGSGEENYVPVLEINLKNGNYNFKAISKSYKEENKDVTYIFENEENIGMTIDGGIIGVIFPLVIEKKEASKSIKTPLEYFKEKYSKDEDMEDFTQSIFNGYHNLDERLQKELVSIIKTFIYSDKVDIYALIGLSETIKRAYPDKYKKAGEEIKERLSYFIYENSNDYYIDEVSGNTVYRDKISETIVLLVLRAQGYMKNNFMAEKIPLELIDSNSTYNCDVFSLEEFYKKTPEELYKSINCEAILLYSVLTGLDYNAQSLEVLKSIERIKEYEESNFDNITLEFTNKEMNGLTFLKQISNVNEKGILNSESKSAIESIFDVREATESVKMLTDEKKEMLIRSKNELLFIRLVYVNRAVNSILDFGYNNPMYLNGFLKVIKDNTENGIAPAMKRNKCYFENNEDIEKYEKEKIEIGKEIENVIGMVDGHDLTSKLTDILKKENILNKFKWYEENDEDDPTDKEYNMFSIKKDIVSNVLSQKTTYYINNEMLALIAHAMKSKNMNCELIESIYDDNFTFGEATNLLYDEKFKLDGKNKIYIGMKESLSDHFDKVINSDKELSTKFEELCASLHLLTCTLENDKFKGLKALLNKIDAVDKTNVTTRRNLLEKRLKKVNCNSTNIKTLKNIVESMTLKYPKDYEKLKYIDPYKDFDSNPEYYNYLKLKNSDTYMCRHCDLVNKLFAESNGELYYILENDYKKVEETINNLIEDLLFKIAMVYYERYYNDFSENINETLKEKISYYNSISLEISKPKIQTYQLVNKNGSLNEKVNESLGTLNDTFDLVFFSYLSIMLYTDVEKNSHLINFELRNSLINQCVSFAAYENNLPGKCCVGKTPIDYCYRDIKSIDDFKKKQVEIFKDLIDIGNTIVNDLIDYVNKLKRLERFN